MGHAIVGGARAAVDGAIEFLQDAQRPTGEFPSCAAALETESPAWEEDTLTFITALVVLGLDQVPGRAAVEPMIDGAVTFLLHQREPGGQWRYWAADHPRHGFTPPDADDTACASMALQVRGIETRENVRLLLANRDHDGRFYTWLVPHRPLPRSPRVWRALSGEVRARTQRAELWETTEAAHGDVDGVVNANVVRYLGARAPAAAVRFVRGLVEDNLEHGCDSWHHSPFALYASVADAHRRGVTVFAGLGGIIEERIRSSSLGTAGSPFDTALALSALVDFGRPEQAPELMRRLVESQRTEGSWERTVCYHGGPTEVFGWASDSLTAAHAASALSRAVELVG